MKMIEQWNIKPLLLPKASEYLEDLSDLRFADSGILTEVNPFFFINEACLLLANSVKLFELGYFDCAFYSVRQAIELSLSGLYLFSNPDKIKGWKNLEKGFELRTIVPELKLGKEEFSEIKELFSDFFERVEKEKKLMNKYVHKQGYRSLYFHYNSFNAHGKPERITALTKDYETILHDTITAVALYRLVIDPYPILMLDEDIVSRMPDLMAESFSRSFVEKYISEEFVDRYKESKLYKGFYDYFISLPAQNEAVYALIHWQWYERKDYDRIKEQHELLSLQDLEAVDLFMSSEKIGAIILDGCIDYHCETKLKDCSLTVGDAYYAKVFEGKDDFNVSYKGNYISRVLLNDGMTYLKHNAVLNKEEMSRIVGLCQQYTNLFAETNERLQEMMEEAGLPAPEYRQNEFMVYATIRQAKEAAGQVAGNGDVNGGLNGQLNGQLNDSQKETFEFIKAHEGYNTTKIADDLGKPFRTIVKHINVLLELNMIERRGSKKTGGYYVKK